MKDSGRTINFMVKGCKNSQMEDNTKAVGSRAACTQEVITAGLTDNNTRDSTT